MRRTAEQHLALAKQLREKARTLPELDRAKAIQHSNGVLALVAFAAKDRGGISVKGFDFDTLTPDWTVIDEQIARLAPINEQRLDSRPAEPTQEQHQEDPHGQVRQLIKLAIESPTPEDLIEFLEFTNRFRRLSVWNARMAHIQRPGARIIASEFEWQKIGRCVLPDAVPIIILWPFSPIRYIYELEDTWPPVERSITDDPFAVEGEFRPAVLSTLETSLNKQKTFRIKIEGRRHGFSYAGSAAVQGVLPLVEHIMLSTDSVGKFASENATSGSEKSNKPGIPAFRVTVNDRLEPSERFVTIAHELGHIFCGHLGACSSRSGRDEETGWRDRRTLGKHEKEIEAEAVAYLVASRAGLLTGSASYLKIHAQRGDIDNIDLDLIVRGAARVERLSKIRYGSMVFSETAGRQRKENS